MIVTKPSELPKIDFDRLHTVYMDFETTSRDPKKASYNPWHHCWIHGLAFTYDDCPETWYILNEALDQKWLESVCKAKRWVNHNIKYDAHVLKNQRGLEFQGELYDTLTIAKLVFSDFMSYSLDTLCKIWLPPKYHKIGDTLKAYLKNSKDFGDIPVAVLAKYAEQDVLATRALYKHLESHLPEESSRVKTVEIALTKVLFELEQRGICISAKTDVELLELEYKYGQAIVNFQQALQQELRSSGKWDLLEEFEPHNSQHCYRLLVEAFGLPVLKYTENGNPCFDKYVLAEYERLSGAPKDLIHRLREFRQLWTLNNLFVEKYVQLNVNGRLHPSFNQSVRTGRMSCSDPNLQQLDSKAKALIVPDEGMAFVGYDYSQIEFRTIVHYINNPAAIRAYNEDPSTDFHTFVAELCQMPRRPAKNVNFMLGYGGGKKKTLLMLQQSEELISELRKFASSEEELQLLARRKALEVYDRYHRTFPELKRTSKLAENVVRHRAFNPGCPENRMYEGKWKRGFVTNLAGRRRYLPLVAAYRAFNSINQSTAADIMKDRVVALADYLRNYYPDVSIRAIVHDEVLLCGPEKQLKDENFDKSVREVLCHPQYELRVPILVSRSDVSSESWSACGK